MIDLNNVEPLRLENDTDLVDHRLRETAHDWVRDLFPRARISKDGKEARVADINTGAPPTKNGSCKINLTGEYAGCWYDFGDSFGGGPIDTIMRATGLTGRDLFDKARELASISRRTAIVHKQPATVDRSFDVQFILKQCAPLPGTLGDDYFVSRGLTPPESPDILYHSSLLDHQSKTNRPAIVSVVRSPVTGEPTGGIHRIYLAEDGQGKADMETPKMMLGPCAGGVVMLAEMTPDGTLGVGEGLENTQAASQLAGMPCWSTLSTSGMRGFGFPHGLRRLAIFADRGQAGEEAAEHLRDRAVMAGIDANVVLPQSDDDFNDDVRQGYSFDQRVEVIAPPRSLDDLVAAAEALTQPHDPNQLRVIIRGMVIARLDTVDCDHVFRILKKAGVGTMMARQMLRDARRDVGVLALPISRTGLNAPWLSKLALWENGEPKPMQANVMIPLREAEEFRGVLSMDEFAGRINVQRCPPWPNPNWTEPRVWDDADELKATEWIQTAGICAPRQIVMDAMQSVAGDNRFHPVRDWLDQFVWDGVPRLDRWLVEYCCVEDTPYARAVAARFLISAVARVFVPGIKVDCALILEGKQGLGKSTALRLLFDPWFADEIADLGTKDSAMQLRGAWCIELAELDALRRAEVSRLKSFISRTNDRYRPPYGRTVVDVPRQCVFAGSVNDDQYLRDPTGGRRFWPVKCQDRVDRRGLWGIREQLWAEARNRYRDGENWYLAEDDLVAAATEEQADRQQHHPWLEAIAEYLDTHPDARNGVTTGQILKGPLFKETERWTEQDQVNVGKCMKALGWLKRQRRVNGRRVYVYLPPDDL